MHHHDHHHSHHSTNIQRVNRAFVGGIALNVLFVVVEAGSGFWTGSLSLLTDAGHNLSDVGSLGLSLLAFRMARFKSKNGYSYGYRKSTVLASLANALLLLLAMGALGLEGIRRLGSPPEVPGITVAIVAGIGIFINAFTAWLFFKDQHKDINIKGAYLHMAADAAVSAGVVVGGLLMHYTHWTWIDPVLSFGILCIILWSTWGLLKGSLRLALDGVPAHIDLDEIKAMAMQIAGVEGIHHIHVWPLSTTETALTAHLVLKENFTPELVAQAKKAFRHALLHKEIQHVTLEVECVNDQCAETICHPIH